MGEKLEEVYRAKVADLLQKNIDLRRDMEAVLRADQQKYDLIEKLKDEIHGYEMEQRFRQID